MTTDGKVLPFEPGRVDLSIERYSADEERECRHGDYRINPRRRWVRCGACRERLDPFDVLLRYAERDASLYQRDEAAKGVAELLRWFDGRDLKVAFDGGMVASALGRTGRRVETTTKSYRHAGAGELGALEGLLSELKTRLEMWTERELVYPRFTLTRRSAKRFPDGHIEVGLLGTQGWTRIAMAKTPREAHEAIRAAVEERKLTRWAMEDRPRKMWMRRP